RAAGRPRPLRDPVLLRAALRSADRMLAELHRPRQPAALGADHLRRLADLLVRRELRPERPARRRVSPIVILHYSLKDEVSTENSSIIAIVLPCSSFLK